MEVTRLGFRSCCIDLCSWLTQGRAGMYAVASTSDPRILADPFVERVPSVWEACISHAGCAVARQLFPLPVAGVITSNAQNPFLAYHRLTTLEDAVRELQGEDDDSGE